MIEVACVYKKKFQTMVCILFYISEKWARPKTKGVCVKERCVNSGFYFISDRPNIKEGNV